jgi:hypothetical protein
MTKEELTFLRDFYRAVMDRPIEFDGANSTRYVPFYEEPAFAEHDPVKLMARSIEFSPGESVQLFSGFRGSGKSTELRRLRKHLLESGNYKVVLVDIEDYINLSQPVDVSDFLMALTGSFGDALHEAKYLSGDPAAEDPWMRLSNFLTRTSITVPEVSVGASAGASTPDKILSAVASGGLKVALKSDPSFRQKLQERMAGHLGALVQEVQTYVQECVKKVKARSGQDTEVVLVVDSMEHLRGTYTNASATQDSVVNLFANHSEKLHFNHLHVIYTIPPYLKVLQPNLGTLYAPGGVQMLPTLKVRERETRKPFNPGLATLQRMLSNRGDWQRLLGAQAHETLEELSLLSGGHLRDFLRLIAEILRRADQLPVPRSTIDAAITQVRSEFLPIANEDAKWLDLIATSHTVELEKMDRLHDLARYLDTHLALCYRNGLEWYDIHPLVRDHVKAQVEELKKRESVK